MPTLKYISPAAVEASQERPKPDPCPPATIGSVFGRIGRIQHEAGGWSDRDHWDPRLTVRPRVRNDGVLAGRGVSHAIATRDVRRAARERAYETIWMCAVGVTVLVAIVVKVAWF